MAQLVISIDTSSDDDSIRIDILSMSKDEPTSDEKQLASKVLELIASSESVPKAKNLRL